MTMKRKHRAVIPAESYDSPKDLWVVSTYFDSEGYMSKLQALKAYVSVMERSGIPLLLVEGAFGRSPFLLPKSDQILRIRCPSVMWQKERLLNLAIDHLPDSCRKVAWLDTDIFFENPRWAVETSNLLDNSPIVQPFDSALWLPKGTEVFRGRGIAWAGFAAVEHNHPGLFLSGDFDRHGHSGYAWAARKDLIQEHGLYDRSIAGSGDHLMAHAMMGDLSSPCVTNSVGAANPFRDSFHAWAKPFHRDVRSRVGFVRGAVLHRWHGDRKKRGYYKRMVGLLARDYNPSLDVRVASSGALEWTENGAALGRWLKDYFSRRQEDGKPGPVERIPWNYLEGLRRDAPGRLDEAIRPFAPLLGPLATQVAERSEDWAGAGLTPVLPNLVAGMILTSSSIYKTTELAELLPTTEAFGAKDHIRGDGWKIFGLFASFDVSEATFSGKSRISGELTFAAAPGHSRLLDASGPLVRRGSKEAADSFETANSILEEILRAAKRFEEMTSSQWKLMTPEGRWAALSGISEWRFVPLSEQLKARIRDPRWNDAPELKTASRKLRNRRARLARHESPARNPYDAVVGPGSAADGLEHV
ncbi:MAG: hypothetical protein JRN58_01830 [Nitrososphaerota archaeon]|nr:hypothetical protein [Nitrososphaerota archaeon]